MNGYRLPTEAEKTAAAPHARAIADLMIGVTRKQITADEFRTSMRTLRNDLGDTLFDIAKSRAVPMHIAACG
jgi:hypothetical protein